MSRNTYSTVDRLSDQAQSAFANITGGGLLTAVILLSGVLSAIFFWQNSHLVFANVWPPAAIALGLAVGLVPAEGAFFGWKRIRQTKHDMTQQQLKATTWGLVMAVICSIFSTFALYVASFEYVPIEIKAYESWLVFLALSIPIVSQVAIYAWFAVNERTVVENHERAKLGAMGFDAWIRAEQARLQSIINGIDTALDRQLEQYGAEVGQREAGRILNEGARQLLAMGDRQTEGTAVQTREEIPDWLRAEPVNNGRDEENFT